ncbi:glutaredoxin 3 [Thalassotalea atypica]|uniref:glutaredoxin 3 n=1 Tax=Thalassotalea atypica TaxID=2054316 RepID=UPI002573A98C|nr:glutaredoxin 3 [Thalassotalea atypica]
MPKIEIYTKGYCPFCKMAKMTLKKLNVAFQEYDITFDNEKTIEMQSRSKRSTVPQIFIGDVHIGGNDDLQAALDSGKLAKILSTKNIEA